LKKDFRTLLHDTSHLAENWLIEFRTGEWNAQVRSNSKLIRMQTKFCTKICLQAPSPTTVNYYSQFPFRVRFAVRLWLLDGTIGTL
jgi:hypothetical protein